MAIALRADAVIAIETLVIAKATNAMRMRASAWLPT
jgi:hypothetical protein